MKYLKLIFCLILFFNICNAQNRYILKINNNEGKFLPYASISWGKFNGITANQYGIVEIEANLIIDTITVSCVGYIQKDFTIRSFEKNQDTIQLYLNNQESILNPVIVFSKEKSIELGIYKKQTSFISNKYRNVIAAVIIQQPTSVCRIYSISFFINKNSQENVPLRIRAYTINNQGLPDNDLLIENIVINKYKTNSWNEVLLADYNICIAEKQFFIGIEWLNSINDYKNNDLQVGLTNQHDSLVTYYKLANKKWMILKSSCGKSDNIMLKTTLNY